MRPRGENIEYDKLRDRLTSDKARLQMRIGELEAALHGLYDDNVDYLRLNNLGGYDNHWLVAARIALGFPAEPSIAPIKGGQLCHLCNAVHDLMSACPPADLAEKLKNIGENDE